MAQVLGMASQHGREAAVSACECSIAGMALALVELVGEERAYEIIVKAGDRVIKKANPEIVSTKSAE